MALKDRPRRIKPDPRPRWANYIDCLTWREGDRLIHSPGSNFYLEPDGTHVEGEFQAAKAGYTGLKARRYTDKLARMPPAKAKAAGRNGPMRADWDKVKVSIMQELVFKKFREHDDCWEWLRDSKERLIVEGNWWHDNFWGQCRCDKCQFKIKGKNHLGIILMEVRWVLRMEGR